MVRKPGSALSRVYSRCSRLFLAVVKGVGSAFALLLLLAGRAAKALWHGLTEALKEFARVLTAGRPYYRHTVPVRVMHWVNVVCLAILLMSGLNIFEAHPALYWGDSSYRGVPPLAEIRGRENAAGEVSGVTRILGHDFDTTGFLGASKNADGELTPRTFPSWLTIPDSRWLAMARRWHFFFAWLFLLNGLAFVAYSLTSGHVRHDLIPTGKDMRSIGRSILDHMRLRHESGEATRRYNVLQKLAYLGIIFFLLPLMILMGLGMSPALDALYPGWIDIFFGRQSVRTIHFIVAWTIVLFAFVHVFEVVVSGFWNNARSMVTGYYRIGPEEDHEKRR
jgi:thiosulfate reductase cytochrome b subunit